MCRIIKRLMLVALFMGSMAMMGAGCEGGEIRLGPVADTGIEAGTDGDADQDGDSCPDCVCNCSDECEDMRDIVCECDAKADCTAEACCEQFDCCDGDDECPEPTCDDISKDFCAECFEFDFSCEDLSSEELGLCCSGYEGLCNICNEQGCCAPCDSCCPACDSCCPTPPPAPPCCDQYCGDGWTELNMTQLGGNCFDCDGDGLVNIWGPKEVDPCPCEQAVVATDTDADGIIDTVDHDGDGVFEMCPEDDAECRALAGDGCPCAVASTEEEKAAQETDSDYDGVGDFCDNCPGEPRENCMNPQGEVIGVCLDPRNFNPDQFDFDLDGVGDRCDSCDRVWTEEQDADACECSEAEQDEFGCCDGALPICRVFSLQGSVVYRDTMCFKGGDDSNLAFCDFLDNDPDDYLFGCDDDGAEEFCLEIYEDCHVSDCSTCTDPPTLSPALNEGDITGVCEYLRSGAVDFGNDCVEVVECPAP